MPITKGLDKLVKYNNRSIKDLTTTPTAAGGGDTGALVLIKTLTASSSGTLSFVDGSSDVVLDNTYPVYKFQLINIHPSANGSSLAMNLSIDSGSNYNVAKTTTFFYALNAEDNSYAAVTYATGDDLAQGTGFQPIAPIGYGNDECGCASMFLFNPSSTTFVKHFLINSSSLQDASGDMYERNNYASGYANTTSAVNAVQFKMLSGNIDAGTIKLYGIKDA